MATKKDRNEVTAEELFNKLVGKDAKVQSEKNPFSEMLSSINLTSENDGESESDLDINELLKKYLPELDDEEEPDDISNLDDIVAELRVEEPDEISDLDDIVAELREEEPDEISDLDDIVVQLRVEERPPLNIGEGILTEYEIGEESEQEQSEITYEQASEDIDEVDAEEESSDAPDVAFEESCESDDGIVADSPVVDETDADVAQSASDEEYLKTKSFLDKLLENAAKPEQEPSAPDTEDESAADEAVGLTEAKEYDDSELTMSDSLFSTADAEEENSTADDSAVESTEGGSASEGSDPLDINLMIAFDMDSDDEDRANAAKIAGDKFEKSHDSAAARKFELDRPEYVDKSQTADIRAEFKKKKISIIIRAVLCAVFTAALFVFENIASLTQLFTGSAKQFTGAVDPALYPVVYIMVSLQLMLLACLCAIPEILDGLKSMFKGTPKVESMTGIFALSGIIYSVVMCNLIVSPNEPVMLNFVVALSALLTLISAGLNNKREMMNFRIVSSKKAKNVVRRMQEEESECETKAFGVAEDDACDVMKIEKTGFVENFFTRLRTPVQSNSTAVMFLIGVSIAVGVIIGIFASFRSGSDGASAWRSAFSAMYLVAPMSVFFAFSYPFYRANRAAKEYDSAIIGESSLDEYSNASIISFDDKNVFPSYGVKVQNIRIYNNARIDRVLYYASSVFSYAGGPLQDVFEITTKDMETSENVQIFESESGLLATQVDGVNIIFGTYDALTARGLEIPEKAAGDDVDLSSELSIMYMFRESVLVAKMYIKYDMDEDIDVILKQFSGDGLYVCVRTFDPNIDEAMIAKKLGGKKLPLKIIRYLNPAEVGKFEEKVDSGLVTCSTPKSLLQVISYCEKVNHTKKTNVALSILSVMIGAAALLLLLLANSMGMLTSLVIAIYQLVWLVPTLVATKMFIR